MKITTKRILLGFGCAFVFLVLTCGGIVGGAFYLLFSRFENMEPVRAALAHAQADERVVELLGTPLEVGFVPRNISIRHEMGTVRVELDMPIRGPRGGGDLVATGVHGRDDPAWDWRRFTVYVEGEAVQLPTPSPLQVRDR